jgi:dynein heavy chain, axonemal
VFATPEDNEVLVFADYDGLQYDVTLLHIDCNEIFAHYNHKIVSALVKCTKRSMEVFKKRSNVGATVLENFSADENEKPLLRASIELRIPEFKIVPTVSQLQKSYEATLVNIIETNYAVPTWGKEAKTKERLKRKPLIDEIRHEKHFFKTISEHNDVMRYKLTFENGLLRLEPKILQICGELREKYSYLWSSDRDEQLEKFVNSVPLLPDIRDKLREFDEITEDILNLEPFICVRTIEIDQTKMIAALAEESKAWKSILGAKLSDFYKAILTEATGFIQEQQKKLERHLEDLDDCRIAMVCLQTIRENFFRLDENLTTLEQVYALFSQFHLNIPAADVEKVDGLRYNFNNMIKAADDVKLKLVQNLQVPLFNQLEEGIEQFKKDLAIFNEDFVKIGPMVPGIPVKEAMDRVLLYDVILQELSHRNEIYSDGETLFGMVGSNYPQLKKRKEEVAFLHDFFKTRAKVSQSIEHYSSTLISEVSVDDMKTDLEGFAEQFKALEAPKRMKSWSNLKELQDEIDQFLNLCPTLKVLTNSALKDDHWKTLEEAMNFDFSYKPEDFTLGVIIAAPLADHTTIINEVLLQALADQEKAKKVKKPALDEF